MVGGLSHQVAVMQFRNERVAFAVHLGDIVDGQNRINSQSDTALERVSETRLIDSNDAPHSIPISPVMHRYINGTHDG